MIELFCYACDHRFLLFVPALFFFSLLVLQFLSALARDRAAEREKEAKKREAEERKRRAEEERRAAAEAKAARTEAAEAAPKRAVISRPASPAIREQAMKQMILTLATLMPFSLAAFSLEPI